MSIRIRRRLALLGVGAAAAAGLGALAPLEPISVAVTSALSVALLSLPALLVRSVGFLPLFTRLAPADLLESGARSRIVALLRTEPGLGITDVCQRLGIGWGTAVHHLTRLEAAGLVVSQDAGRRRRFFLPHESESRRTAVCVLTTEMNRRLLEHIRDHPGVTQRETCAALGLSAPLAHKYMARLIGRGLVAAVREWRSVRYYTTDSVRDAMHEFAQLGRPQEAEGPSDPLRPRSPTPPGPEPPRVA